MIETAAAIRNLDQILDVPGLDFVFVGPDDLALSMGHELTTEPTEPRVLDAIEAVRVGSRKRELPVGIYCGSTEMTRRWAKEGFQILAVSSDTALLARAASEAARLAREVVRSDRR
jgi:4-hydroxy-2-oxoheptanedioate aldolase